jgi:predicted  nucleic acid-binding Zn-ribbon protein
MKRLDVPVEEAHAKLVSLADTYKKQQRKVEALEKNLEENAQEANDELKAVMNRTIIWSTLNAFSTALLFQFSILLGVFEQMLV